MSRMTKAILELVRIGLAIAGIFLLIDNGGKAYEAYRSQSWPTTTGEITRSAVEIRANALGKRSYYSSIKYSYTVEELANDDPLVSKRVGIDAIPPADTRANAEERLEPYPQDSIVKVYYNPNRPEKSFLEPNFLFSYLLIPIMGLICLGAAISPWVMEKRNN